MPITTAAAINNTAAPHHAEGRTQDARSAGCTADQRTTGLAPAGPAGARRKAPTAQTRARNPRRIRAGLAGTAAWATSCAMSGSKPLRQNEGGHPTQLPTAPRSTRPRQAPSSMDATQCAQHDPVQRWHGANAGPSQASGWQRGSSSLLDRGGRLGWPRPCRCKRRRRARECGDPPCSRRPGCKVFEAQHAPTCRAPPAPG